MIANRKSYIFIWNPITWPWANIESCIEQLEGEGSLKWSWKCGNTKSIAIGDRIFLIKLGSKPKGIIASGYAASQPYLDKKAGGLYVAINFEVLINPEIEPILPIEELQTGRLAKQGSWTPQASGISIKPAIIGELEKKWFNFLKKQGIKYTSSTSPKGQDVYLEGRSNIVLQTRYERDIKARNACLKHYKYTCHVCDLNFEEKYGDIGKGFIHVHHLTQIAAIGKEYKINPVKHLRPVCPNCHAMLHKRNPPFTIEELRKRLLKNSK